MRCGGDRFVLAGHISPSGEISAYAADSLRLQPIYGHIRLRRQQAQHSQRASINICNTVLLGIIRRAFVSYASVKNIPGHSEVFFKYSVPQWNLARFQGNVC